MQAKTEMLVRDATERGYPLAVPTSKKEGVKDAEMPTRSDTTRLPNWMMPILCTVIIGLICTIFTFVVSSLQRDITKLEERIASQEAYMKDTREKLIANRWVVGTDGKLYPPIPETTQLKK